MKKILGVFLVLLFLLCGCKKKEEVDVVEENIPEIKEGIVEPNIEEQEEEEPRVFAIFGVDSRNNAYGIGTRSDTIMLVSINDEEKTVKVASILRDTLFYIDGHEYEKVTHAHSYGGPKLALKTINENLDLNLDKYMTVNFNSFKELVDLIGGIEVEINASEIERIKQFDGKYSGYITSPGTYILDGDQALDYSRNRSTEGGDIRRSERQRTVLFAIFEKAKGLSLDSKLKIATLMLDTISTNFEDDEALSLVRDIQNYEIEEMASYPQIFYAGLIPYSYGNRYVEIPFSLEDMAYQVHEYLDIKYDGPSEMLAKHSDFIQTIVDGPNTDTTESYGNYKEKEVKPEIIEVVETVEEVLENE